MAKITTPVIDSYFHYTLFVDFAEKRLSVLANILFRNNTQDVLHNPEVLLRISPKGSAEVSGKIISPKLAKVFAKQKKDGSLIGWAFTDNKWMLRGKQTGEYHIRTLSPLQITPGEWSIVDNIQLDFNMEETTEPVRIEAFIRVQPNEQICGVINPILINGS